MSTPATCEKCEKPPAWCVTPRGTQERRYTCTLHVAAVLKKIGGQVEGLP